MADDHGLSKSLPFPLVKADDTSATLTQKGIARILASNEPLTGVVLNQFDAKKSGNYYYDHQYREYYQAETT